MTFAEQIQFMEMLHELGKISADELAEYKARAFQTARAHVAAVKGEYQQGMLERMVTRKLIDDGVTNFRRDDDRWLIASRDTLLYMVESDVNFNDIEVSEDGVFALIRREWDESDATLNEVEG